MSDSYAWDAQDPLLFVENWRERFVNQSMSRDFFPLLHSAAEYLRVSGQAQRAVELLQCEASMGVERYIGHRLEHARQLVLALFETGKKKEAQDIVNYYASRPYLFDDLGKLAFFLFFRSLQALEEHDATSLVFCLTLLMRTQAGAQDACFLRIIHQAGGLRKFFAQAGRLGASTCLLLIPIWAMHQLTGKGLPAAVIARGLHICLNMLRTLGRLRGGNQAWMLRRRAFAPQARPRDQNKKDKLPILVTRAMGGIGDILMMTPGLKALRRKYPDREIHFAVPKVFHSLLAHNPDVVLKDINGEILYREDFFHVHNLTECPASRVESATLPRVKKNRIDIFSAAMGIGTIRLNRLGRKPVYTVTEEENAWAENFFAEHCLTPKQCIAVQPYAADSYKDYPHMRELVAYLAEEHPVLVFHGTALRGFDHPRVLKIDRYSLRQSLALLSLCEKLVAVDSAFVHAAAAFDKKTVALFGPTDGAIFTKYYRNCTVVTGYTEAECKACWRNQSIVCGKSCKMESACLRKLYIKILNII